MKLPISRILDDREVDTIESIETYLSRNLLHRPEVLRPVRCTVIMHKI